MNHCSKLFEISEEISNFSSQKEIQIASEFIIAHNDSGEIKIYSIIKNSIIYQETNISAFAWLNSTSISTPILAILSNSTLKLITFVDHIDEVIPFDATDRLAAFSIQKLNDNCSILCEFNLQFTFKSFVPFDINSLVILDDQDTLHQFSLFPDGLYSIKSCRANGCSSFTFSGLYLAGQSTGNIHFWTSNLNYICSTPVSGTTLCSVSSDRFAVINNDEKNAELLIVDSANSNAKNEKVELKEQGPTDFISICEDGKVLSKPQDATLITRSYYIPLFIKGKEIFTFDNDIFIQRIAAAFPIAVSIPILATRANRDESGTQFVANTMLKVQNPQLFESYLNANDPKNSIDFLVKFISIVKENSSKDELKFTQSLNSIIHSYCTPRIQKTDDPISEGFSTVLVNYRDLFYPYKTTNSETIPPYKTNTNNNAPQQIKEERLLEFVLDALDKRQISNSLPSLKLSFPNYSPFQLFRTLVLQQAWCKVCSGKIEEEARPLLLKLGEDPIEHFYLMWKSTTRNGTRQLLYEYLCRKEKILPKSDDERHHKILKSITDKYPNTSFLRAQQQLSTSSSSAIRSVQSDDSKLPPWQPIVDINKDFNENKSMIFPNLFKIEDEKPVESSSYFVGNILLIEAQEGKGSLNWLENKEDPIDKLWILHCEHRINDLALAFESELKKSKAADRDKLDCIKFVDKYYEQMNTYELETLLDLLCKNGYFAQKEYDNFELLLVRICKNQFLFSEGWWNNQAKIDFGEFFKQFAQFCAKKSLFMPFEMFVLAHPKARSEDISSVKEPLINFIWDLWVKRDPSAATLSCMQFIAKSSSKDPVELWNHLPSDSLAPLASYVWNKDPTKFKAGSRETIVLSERLKNDYPLLSSLVKGEIPHPQGPIKEPPPSDWRSPIYTSKYDLELHDLIQGHFANYDFHKVFTDYYGRNNPGEANFPHFDHPELITKPSEPPYVHYVKLMLPVSAFQQAVEDGVKEDQFKEICVQCLKEGLFDKQIRLAVLSFIELVDIKFKWDYSIDYKLDVALYDILVKGVNGRDKIVDMLISIYLDKNKDAANELKRLLEPSPDDIEIYLLQTLLGIRCNLPLDYTPINIFASNGKTAELLLFIDRAAELGAHYPIAEVEKIVTEKMPRDNPLRAHLLFHLKQSLPSEEGSMATDIPALVVYRAVKRTDQPQDISLLQEALNRKVQLYALLATSIQGANLMLCALVTMLTMVEGQSNFDVTNPPPHDQMVTLFMQTLSQLLSENKSLELVQTLDLFSENSIVANLVHFYRSIELFAFRRTESVLPDLNSKLKQDDPNAVINDDLLGEVPIKSVIEIFFPMLDKLVKLCAERSQIHVFRFLQVLNGSIVSPFLEPRVKLCKVIAEFENFRRAIVHCDLLGSPDKIVSDLVLNHSLALGQAAAECLGISADAATKQWLTFQYSNAATASQVLEIHEEIVPSIQNADPLFFIYLFASILPYEQPTLLIPIITYAQSIMTSDEYSTILKYLNALLLLLNICKENNIEVQQSPGGLPNLHDILKILFPGQEEMFKDAPQHIPLSIASPVLYGLDTLQRFFESSVDKAIDICLDKREADNAHLICEWRNRDPHNIQLLEAVQSVISDEELSPENKELIEQFGNPKEDMEGLLQNIAKSNGWRFVLISLHYKAAKLLNLPTTNLLHRKTSEFIESKLAVDTNNWDLIRELITTSKMSSSEVASCLGQAYANHVKETLAKGNTTELSPTQLSPDDYDETFMQFTKLCENPTAVGEKLFDIAKKGSKVQVQTQPPPVAHPRNPQQKPQQQQNQQQNQQNQQANQQANASEQQNNEQPQQQPKELKKKLFSKLPAALNPLLNKNKEDKNANQEDKNKDDKNTNQDDNNNNNNAGGSSNTGQPGTGSSPGNAPGGGAAGQKKPMRPRPKPKPKAEVDPALLLPVNVVVNLLLHASLCTADIDEIAELLDALLFELTNDSDKKLIIDIVSIFPDPALIPRFFQYLIAQERLDDLPHQNLNEKVGRVIMNCARHHHPFEPQKYLELTLKYNLFRDHAELQMERGNKLLDDEHDKMKLQDASRHFLLALAYFLHEKCYSLSMECLKKLSLISLQIEMSEPPILRLDKAQVQQFMNTKDFPFALTVAVAYDMDNEANWAEAIYNQSVLKQGDDFLTAFQYFRPITSTLCDGVVRKYKAANLVEGQQDRMKSFLTNIPNLVERYRIAKSLDFKDQIDNMKAHNPVVCEWCERVLMSKQ